MDEAIVRWLMKPSNEDLTTVNDLFGRPHWQRYGACHGAELEVFMPGVGGNFKVARALCAGCEVRQECFDFAMADDELVGMWGGTTERERRQLRGQRGAA